jgi:hypothetical protein
VKLVILTKSRGPSGSKYHLICNSESSYSDFLGLVTPPNPVVIFPFDWFNKFSISSTNLVLWLCECYLSLCWFNLKHSYLFSLYKSLMPLI